MSTTSLENTISDVPEQLKPWLLTSESLTKRLRASLPDVSINLLNANWDNTTWWDKYILNIQYERAYIRQVIISSATNQCWFARTVIPQATYEKRASLFANLSSKSLGDVLFHDKSFKRQQLAFYPVTSSDIEYHWAMAYSSHSIAKQLWVRRSVFMVEGEALYILEVFLPSFVKLLCKD